MLVTVLTVVLSRQSGTLVRDPASLWPMERMIELNDVAKKKYIRVWFISISFNIEAYVFPDAQCNRGMLL